MIAENIYLNF